MRRVSLSVASLALILLATPVFADDPTPVERQLTLQRAMVTARQFLDVSMPAEAVTTLEAEVTNADGNKAFMTLLREAYLAELYRLEKDGADANAVAQVRKKLSLLGGAAANEKPAEKPVAKPAAAPPPSPPPALPEPSLELPAVPGVAPRPAVTEITPEVAAAAAFKKGDFAVAAKLFASAPSLTADQKAAWAYSRIKVAADKVNAATCDPATAAACAADVAEAAKLIPQHAELRAVADQLVSLANQKAGGRRETASGDVVETSSFRVRHSGNRELADAVAKAAETQRKAIFERWSGPPAGPWDVKCEIVLHANAETYAKATGRPVGCTGTAAVRLTNNRATERRIDLRADDAGVTANALPREITHVVLADLFPDKPPPKWAAEGMAVLACSPEEVARYTRTLPRCARDGDWFALAQLMELKDFPAEKITGFYCQSVSLTEFLVRLGGDEKNFTTFVRDCLRYGTPQALRRQYNIDGPQALEAAWKRSALDVGRGQAP